MLLFLNGSYYNLPRGTASYKTGVDIFHGFAGTGRVRPDRELWKLNVVKRRGTGESFTAMSGGEEE